MNRRFLQAPFLLSLVLGLSGCGTVTVTGVQNSIDCTNVADPDFTNDVVPTFGAAGKSCDQSGCHIGTSPAGDLDLDGGGSATTIFNSLVTSGALDANSDPADPLNSILIAKPFNGLLDHEGGVFYDDFDDQAMITVYCWIESGAAQ